MRAWLVVVLAGCYRPTVPTACTVTCDFAATASCPDGLMCLADNLCHDPETPACAPEPDGGPLPPDGAAIPMNYVFVTSTTVTPGTLGGFGKADMECSARAIAAGLPGTYVAWLSQEAPGISAVSRLGTARGWVRPDMLPVADTVEDLVAGKLFYPPRLDEMGHDHSDGSFAVVTGTEANGTATTSRTCTSYTTTAGAATWGVPDATTVTWTNVGTPPLPCNADAHLYCFGIDHTFAVGVDSVVGKRAFVSTIGFSPDTGLANADNICTMEAFNAGLGSNFRALLAEPGRIATNRFTQGGPWFRVDNVQIGTLDAPLAPINVTTGRAYVTSEVWTGAASPATLGDATGTCNDWAAKTSTNGWRGDSTRSDPKRYFGLQTDLCMAPRSVYCLEP
jgi:hypothetical protein